MYLILLITMAGVIGLLAAHAGNRLQTRMPRRHRVVVSIGTMIAIIPLYIGITALSGSTNPIAVVLISAGYIGFIVGLNILNRSA